MYVLPLSLVLLIAGPASTEGSCIQPSNYQTWNHHAHEYLFANELDDFDGAASKCRCWSGYLARVDTAAENTVLRHQSSIFDDGMGNGYFIGAKSDIGIQHKFVWSEDSSRLHYFDWWRGQPNNAYHRDSACIALFRLEHYHWNDVSCNGNYYYICERGLHTHPTALPVGKRSVRNATIS